MIYGNASMSIILEEIFLQKDEVHLSLFIMRRVLMSKMQGREKNI